MLEVEEARKLELSDLIFKLVEYGYNIEIIKFNLIQNYKRIRVSYGCFHYEQLIYISETPDLKEVFLFILGSMNKEIKNACNT